MRTASKSNSNHEMSSTQPFLTLDSIEPRLSGDNVLWLRRGEAAFRRELWSKIEALTPRYIVGEVKFSRCEGFVAAIYFRQTKIYKRKYHFSIASACGGGPSSFSYERSRSAGHHIPPPRRSLLHLCRVLNLQLWMYGQSFAGRRVGGWSYTVFAVTWW